MRKFLLPIIMFLLVVCLTCVASCDHENSSGKETSSPDASGSQISEQPSVPTEAQESYTDPAYTEEPTHPSSETTTETAEETENRTEALTDPFIGTETDTEPESETEPATEPDPELPGDDDLDRLDRILNGHNDRLDKCTYTCRTENVNYSVMTLNGDVSESTETEIEDVQHTEDGSFFTLLTITDDYDSYSDKTWYVDGILYDEFDESDRCKVRLSEDDYNEYVQSSSGTLDEVISFLSSEDISFKWDRDSSLFHVTFAVTDPDMLRKLMVTLMGEEAGEVELSDLSFSGVITTNVDGWILSDEVRLGYSMSYFGIVIRSEFTSTETFDYNGSFTIVPPENEDLFTEVSVEEYFGQ